MKINEILLEGRPGRQNVKTMYHGTSSVYLPSIKKFGLLPNTPNKGFGDVNYGYETYGGVYLTADRGTAEEAAEEVSKMTDGDPIIITVQYVLGSGGSDEDQVTMDIINAYEENKKLEKFFQTMKLSDVGKNLPHQDHKIFYDLHTVIRKLKRKYGADAQEDILADPAFRQLVKKIIEKTKIYNIDQYTNVRVTRPIGFRGKTRITKIESI